MERCMTHMYATTIFLLLVFPTASLANIITFDVDPPDFQQGYGEGSIYEENGFFLSTVSDPGRHGSIIRFNPETQNAAAPNNGSIHMGATFFSNPWLQKSDGGIFSLISLEIAEYSEFVRPPEPLNITGLTAGGQILSANLSIDNIFDGVGGVEDFQFFSINWDNLIRLDFNSTGFSFDNIHVDSVPVPEPVPLILFVLGLSGLVIARTIQSN